MIAIRASDVLAGGADSPVRAGAAVGGDPFVQVRGAGPYAYDADGRRFIDYIMAYGPLLLGHAHPALCAGLDAVAGRGALFGSTHPDEIALASRIRAHLPSMERLRFTTTGSEAVMSAIRVARAYTGRALVVKFGGNYHGHFDLALLNAGASAATADASRSGIPASVTHDLALARYNDLDSLDAILERDGARVAAVVVEPVCANMGLVMPQPGFLEGIVARAHAHGALVIFDEVITWLRLGLGGAQRRLGVTPDLTTLGKVLGGGFPLAAFGGRRDVMAVLAPDGATFTGGTHAGNPFSIAIGHRVLDFLEAGGDAYAAMDRRARRLAGGIRSELARLSLDYAVVQLESIVDFAFRPGPPTRSFEERARADRGAFAAFYHAMRERGVLLAPSQNEVMFLSTEHSDDDVEATIDAVGGALSILRRESIV